MLKVQLDDQGTARGSNRLRAFQGFGQGGEHAAGGEPRGGKVPQGRGEAGTAGGGAGGGLRRRPRWGGAPRGRDARERGLMSPPASVVVVMPRARPPKRPPDNNLPLELSSFVGREREV